ncbi:MAG: fibronectin type III domain-containing protein [Lachnospiraceae bacterium]|nr:fibronectin type III domain-containing protein [Lachnospiraceae bacterium]
MRKKNWKQGFAMLSAAVMALTAFSGVAGSTLKVQAASNNISSPRIAGDGTVTWDMVQFGRYYQDVEEFKTEPIKWRILSIDGDDVFLLADEALDNKPYNTNGVEEWDEDENLIRDSYSCTWETSTLRTWLNDTEDSESFINTAFTQDEQSAIIETTVVNNNNPEYDTEGGNDTKDKVYLLSIEEASSEAYGFNKYSAYPWATRMAAATDYAHMNGTVRGSGWGGGIETSCCWLLRSPGADNYCVEVVLYDGLNMSNFNLCSAVRPALHVKFSDELLSSGILTDAGTITSNGKADKAEAPRTSTSEYGNPVANGDVTTWDCVYFGNYKQNNVSYREKPITWRVLSVDGDDAFLLADQVLDCKPYNDTDTDVTWETSTLRTWLNDTGDSESFINTAFTDAEQAAIKTTSVVNDNNPYTHTEGGNITSDKVYLLSLAEVSDSAYGFEVKLGDHSVTREVKATDYAYMNDAKREENNNSSWWLRSPGSNSYKAANVFAEGNVDVGGENAYCKGIHAVRPALHIDLSVAQNLESFQVSDPLSIKEEDGDNNTSGDNDSSQDNNSDEANNNANGDAGANHSNGNADASAAGQTPAAGQTAVVEQTGTTEQTVTKPAKVTISSAKNSKKKAIVIRWKKVKKAGGYEVQYALNRKFTKSKKTKTTDKLTLTVKNLKKGRTYYVRVRAYTGDSTGKKVYGTWSKVKTVKIQK